MLYIKLLLFAFFSLSFSLVHNHPNETIRRKVENSHFNEMQAFGESLYCVGALKQFYLNRSFELAWDSVSSTELLSAIKRADMEGLNPNDYHLQILMKESTQQLTSALSIADYDLLLTDAFLLYTSHLLSGKVNPQTINAEWFVTKREGDPLVLLEQAISSREISNKIHSATPKHPAYQSLKGALKIYRALNIETWFVIPEGPTIRKDMEDKRIPSIRERLFVLGDLKENSSKDSLRYDENLFAAVQQFQTRHGLDNEGSIGQRTIASLNITVSNRIKQIEANLERWRWLSQEFGDYYIKVNIANFELEVVKNGNRIRTYKVVAGKPYRKTPVFSSRMQYLVFNPTWTVPPGILSVDILPNVQKDITYLDKKKLMVLDKNGNAIKGPKIDWNSREVKDYTYRQPPGPENALGAVKFMFPNNFHVYLHDTPAKELFEKTERAFSSGCIRVQEPLSLAEYLLNDSLNWNREKIDKVIATLSTQTVQLKEKPNVHLLYWTAWANDNNIIQFRKDIYERDKPLIEQLKKQPFRQTINKNGSSAKAK